MCNKKSLEYNERVITGNLRKTINKMTTVLIVTDHLFISNNIYTHDNDDMQIYGVFPI